MPGPDRPWATFERLIPTVLTVNASRDLIEKILTDPA
jgi:hypothetical protein